MYAALEPYYATQGKLILYVQNTCCAIYVELSLWPHALVTPSGQENLQLTCIKPKLFASATVLWLMQVVLSVA